MTDSEIASNDKVPIWWRLIIFLLVQAVILGLPFFLSVWLANFDNLLLTSLRWFIGIWIGYAFIDGLISLVGGASETKSWRLGHNVQIWIFAFFLNIPLQILIAYFATY